MHTIDLPKITFENEVDFTCLLDDARYKGRLTWANGRWFLDLYSVGPDTFVSIIKGTSLVQGYPVLVGNPLANRPPGRITLHSRDGNSEDYAKEDLGTRLYLAYYPADEV